MKTVKTQVVYQTNMDFDASEESIRKSGLVTSDVNPKGTLWFKFKDTETVFLAFHTGKLQVRWKNPEEKKTLFKIVKNLLVARSGEVLKVTSTHQTPEIPYPLPDAFKLYWCDEETEYVKKPSIEMTDVVQIRQDYVNGKMNKAFRRVLMLLRAQNSLPKWAVEMKDTFDLFNSESEAMKTDPFERMNPDRQRRILEYETAIVSEALKHWT